jgi:hypothetical protein
VVTLEILQEYEHWAIDVVNLITIVKSAHRLLVDVDGSAKQNSARGWRIFPMKLFLHVMIFPRTVHLFHRVFFMYQNLLKTCVIYSRYILRRFANLQRIFRKVNFLAFSEHTPCHYSHICCICDSATWYSTYTCLTLLRFYYKNGVSIQNFYFLSYMCGAPERLAAFGARTFLVLSQQ